MPICHLPVHSETTKFNIALPILLILFALFGTLLHADNFPAAYSYKCNNGEVLTAQFDDEDVWLFLPGKTVKLPKTDARDGNSYADQNVTFWSKDEDAMLIVRGQEATACIVNEEATVWELSKLDGADFRAVGNEPGWEVLIFRNAVILSSEYGAVNHVFKHATVYNDKKKKTTTYEAREAGHRIEMVLSQEKCTDSVSDETFETSVSILLDGKQKLSGCGRALH